MNIFHPAIAALRVLRMTTGMGLPETRPVFFSIPKTGSTSISHMLRSAYWDQPILYLPAEGARRERVLKMPNRRFCRYGVYRGFLGMEMIRERIPNPFVFTFLRDPIEHLLSAYYYNLFRGRAEPPLRKMLERWEGDFLTRCIAGDADVDAAIAVLSSMDFIGFTGSLEDDMRRLLEKLGKPNVTVMLKRANPHPAVEDLSQEVRSALVRKTEADREVYAWALRHA